MEIENIKLTNFRNHLNFETELDKKVTVIAGANASGKTNILEAIYLLATAKSFKATYDRDMINHDSDFARVEGLVSDENDVTNLEIVIQKNMNFENASIKKAKVNKVPKQLSVFAGYLKAVLFSPENMEMLTGSPAERRRFLDMILYQVNNKYKKTHTEYIHAVKQRNKVLEKIRDTGAGTGELGFWNTKVVQNGIYIGEEREKAMNYLNKQLKFYGKELGGYDTDLNINYLKSEISYERLNEYREKDIFSRSTLIGPHRDDFVIEQNELNIADFGSRGQQRSAILALKLSEIDLILDRTGIRPILLLDDVFSELDDKHEEAVLDTIQKQQTIITATEVHSHLPHNFSLINIGSQQEALL